MAFTTDRVTYSLSGYDGGVALELNVWVATGPTVAQFDAAVTAFCDALENQGNAPDFVTKTLQGSDNSFGTFWQP